jgi:iron complex transport system substrate-binding protein
MTKKTLYLFFVIIFASTFLLGACTAATPATTTITDGLGRGITLAEPAQKVASLAASNTEILFAIGAGEQVVARDAFSDFPEAALDVTDIGGGWGEIDTETLISLDPDLVLAAEINAPEQVQALEELGLTVFYLANPKDIEGMFDNLLIVAALTGHENDAQTLIGELETRVEAVDEKIAGVTEQPLVFYELDGTDANAPWTSGQGTFIDLLIARAGGENLGNVLEDDWAQISIEELITQNPDIILLGDYILGGVTPEDVAARAGWETIAAVQNKQVITFNDNLVSRPGPRMVDGLEDLAELFHPELFEE